jgi:excisionase family DNA binding protein
MPTAQPACASDRQYLNLAEASAEFTRRGVAVRPSTIRRWHATGKLRTVKLGRILRIPIDEIERFLTENTKFQSDTYEHRGIRKKRRV